MKNSTSFPFIFSIAMSCRKISVSSYFSPFCAHVTCVFIYFDGFIVMVSRRHDNRKQKTLNESRRVKTIFTLVHFCARCFKQFDINNFDSFHVATKRDGEVSSCSPITHVFVGKIGWRKIFNHFSVNVTCGKLCMSAHVMETEWDAYHKSE